LFQPDQELKTGPLVNEYRKKGMLMLSHEAIELKGLFAALIKLRKLE